MSDKIITKPPTKEYEEAWIRVFESQKNAIELLHEECGDCGVTSYHLGTK